MSFLRIQNLYSTFDQTVAVNYINLEIKEGEFFTLLGSSGCGKTTTLRMVGDWKNPKAARSIWTSAALYRVKRISS